MPPKRKSQRTAGASAKKVKAPPKKKVEEEEEEEDMEEDEETTTTTTESPTRSTRSSKRLSEKKEHEETSEHKFGKWKKNGSLLYFSSPSEKPNSVIYSFDLDDTLIRTKSGKKFPTGRSDWQWLYEKIPSKLKELHDQGSRVVIFTNQGGIDGKNGYDETKARSIQGKIQDIVEILGFPVTALVATTEDIYRKPRIAMWKFFEEICNSSQPVTLEKSCYIGDAAGRPDGWKAGRKKDFACTDRKFAANVGIPFKTPEEFFLNEPAAPFSWEGFDPSTLTVSESHKESNEKLLRSIQERKGKMEVLLLVGYPASGKSTLSSKLVSMGFAHVNRDTLKTPAKCLQAAQKALEAETPVVIDNTNPSKDGRSAYIRLAKQFNVPIRCIYFQLSEDMAKHLNEYRERLTDGASPHVPRIGYAVYKKNLQEPTTKEGFEEVLPYYFVPNFDSAKAKELFYQFA